MPVLENVWRDGDRQEKLLVNMEKNPPEVKYVETGGRSWKVSHAWAYELPLSKWGAKFLPRLLRFLWTLHRLILQTTKLPNTLPFFFTTRKEEKCYSKVNRNRPKKGQNLNKSDPKKVFNVFCPGNLGQEGALPFGRIHAYKDQARKDMIFSTETLSPHGKITR